MANSAGQLSTVIYNQPGRNPYQPAAYVAARVLAANTAKSFTVPTNAKFVHLAATDNFYFSCSGTAVVPVDADDGTSNELVPSTFGGTWLVLPSACTSISVISEGTPKVTASFYTP